MIGSVSECVCVFVIFNSFLTQYRINLNIVDLTMVIKMCQLMVLLIMKVDNILSDYYTKKQGVVTRMTGSSE